MTRLTMPVAEQLAGALPDLIDAARDIADVVQGYVDHEPAAIGTVEQRREHLAGEYADRVGGLLGALQRTNHALKCGAADPAVAALASLTQRSEALSYTPRLIEALRVAIDALMATTLLDDAVPLAVARDQAAAAIGRVHDIVPDPNA